MRNQGENFLAHGNSAFWTCLNMYRINQLYQGILPISFSNPRPLREYISKQFLFKDCISKVLFEKHISFKTVINTEHYSFICNIFQSDTIQTQKCGASGVLLNLHRSTGFPLSGSWLIHMIWVARVSSLFMSTQVDNCFSETSLLFFNNCHP